MHGFGLNSEFLLRHRNVYDDERQMKKIREWSSNVMLLKKTMDSVNTQLLQLTICTMPDQDWVERVIGYAYTHIVPSQIRSFTTIITNQQTFKQLTKSNLIASKVSKQGTITDSLMPKIKAPPSAVRHIAHHLKITHLDEEMDETGFQSLSEFIGEIDGFYTFYQEPRYRLSLEKKDDKPLFHGQHLNHWKSERKPQNAICMMNNQNAAAISHKGSLDVEKTNAYLGEQEFQRGIKGLVDLYIQGNKAKLANNFIKFDHWRERNFKEVQWSSKSIHEFDELYDETQTAKHVLEALRDRGYYRIVNYSNEVKQWVEKQVKQHELAFEEKPIWKGHYHEILFHHLMRKPSNWKLTKENLCEIKELFLNMFNDDFMIRRCSEWGFYLH